MMPKVTLRATDGIGGTIHASKSGKTYEHDADGIVIVDHVDVVDLLATHERVPAERTATAEQPADGELPRQVTTDSVTSATEGAAAIDEADRMKNSRDIPRDDGQQAQDHGGATPPHSEPQADASSRESRAEAGAEVDAAERAGVDTEHRSAKANTGHMGSAHANEGDQAEARGQGDGDGADHHDAAFSEFKDHAGQEGDDPKLRGMSKAELDAAGKSA